MVEFESDPFPFVEFGKDSIPVAAGFKVVGSLNWGGRDIDPGVLVWDDPKTVTDVMFPKQSNVRLAASTGAGEEMKKSSVAFNARAVTVAVKLMAVTLNSEK